MLCHFWNLIENTNLPEEYNHFIYEKFCPDNFFNLKYCGAGGHLMNLEMLAFH
jgi:hypothetical protein